MIFRAFIFWGIYLLAWGGAGYSPLYLMVGSEEGVKEIGTKEGGRTIAKKQKPKSCCKIYRMPGHKLVHDVLVVPTGKRIPLKCEG